MLPAQAETYLLDMLLLDYVLSLLSPLLEVEATPLQEAQDDDWQGGVGAEHKGVCQGALFCKEDLQERSTIA